MKDDLRYAASDCFETFPFPVGYLALATLQDAGKGFYCFRASLMLGNNQGITTTFNRFHSPDEQDPGILQLRQLIREMDVAVLRAYGWQDLAEQAKQPDFCQFLLDYEEDEDDGASDSSSTRQKKKPWRYRWPDDFRDEVLARLLELNEQRHKEEMLAAKAVSTAPTGNDKPKSKNRSKNAPATGQQ